MYALYSEVTQTPVTGSICVALISWAFAVHCGQLLCARARQQVCSPLYIHPALPKSGLSTWFCWQKHCSLFSSSSLGTVGKLQRPVTLLDHRQWFSMSTQYFHIWRGEMIWERSKQISFFFRLTKCLLGCWMQWNHSLITMKQLMVWTTGGVQWKENIRTVILHRKNIFIFLSNTGGKEITDAALSTWREGKPREEISFAQVLLRPNYCRSAILQQEIFLWTLENIKSVNFSWNHW